MNEIIKLNVLKLNRTARIGKRTSEKINERTLQIGTLLSLAILTTNPSPSSMHAHVGTIKVTVPLPPSFTTLVHEKVEILTSFALSMIWFTSHIHHSSHNLHHMHLIVRLMPCICKFHDSFCECPSKSNPTALDVHSSQDHSHLHSLGASCALWEHLIYSPDSSKSPSCPY